MKIINSITLLTAFCFVTWNANSFSQSDLEIVNSFKSKQKEIDVQISKASTLSELNTVAGKINKFKTDFLPYKNFLDKSLYPDKFDKTFEKLNLAFVTRNNDFTQIDVLTSQVGELKQQVEFLNLRNNELLTQVGELLAAGKKDKKTIVKLENLVAELKSSLLKRDRLVISMVDSLMPPVISSGASLNSSEIKKIKEEEVRNNVLLNIKKSINNHLEFLDATSLKPSDLEIMNSQKDKFAKTWKAVGIKLVEVYGNESTKSEQLKEIETLFDKWQSALKQEAWNSIYEEFSLNGIHLQKFFSGNEFSDVMEAYITDEIKNVEVKSNPESKKTYENFADSTWYKNGKNQWVPYLVNNKMISEEQTGDIESGIKEWKAAIYPSNLFWLYILVGAVLISSFIFFVIKQRKTAQQKKRLID